MVIVPMVSEFAPPSRHAKLPCYMIEPRVRNPAFFGRAEILNQLDQVLLPTNARLVSSEVGELGLKQFALCGLGGIGKTEIAVEFAYSRKLHFDAIFWVAADETSKLATGFCQIALSLGLEESSQPQSQVVSRELVKGWLSNPTKASDQSLDANRQDDANWLLIFDNVDDSSILDDYWPVGGNGSLLITSRDPLAKTAHSTAAPSIDLEPFSTTEGALFLRQLTQVSDKEEEPQSERIVECLGGLPLAITQMAGIIRRQYLSYSEFLERYEDETELPELHSLSIGHPSQQYHRTIASVWAFDALGEEAQMLLKITSLLDADRIQEHIFLEGASKVDTKQYPKKPSSLAAARAELLHASFIKRNAQKREFWVHRLVQDSMRAKMSLEETQATIDITITLILTVWPSWDVANKHNMTRWNKCEEYYPHVLALSKAYGKLFRKGQIDPDLRFATLLNDAGW
jgi:NB-ARC domain